jgi:hypothetical protein
MGALKKGLNPRARELGVYICGGRGKQSRNTPRELQEIAGRTGLDGDALVRTSRLTARIDNNAVADGFQIYLHAFVLTADGDWAVVQQGMNEATRLARRYHWHSAAVTDFTADPHTAIVGTPVGAITNLVDGRARPAQDALIAIGREDPGKNHRRGSTPGDAGDIRVRPKDVNARRLGAVLRCAGADVRDFASFLLLVATRAAHAQSLALVAESCTARPRARRPRPLCSSRTAGRTHRSRSRSSVDESIAVLRRALDAAKLGRTEKRTGRQARRADRTIERRIARNGTTAWWRTSAPSRRRSAGGRYSTTRARRPERPRRGQPDLFGWERANRPVRDHPRAHRGACGKVSHPPGRHRHSL